MTTQAPEVWWRNPRFYIRECVEIGALNSIWTPGSARKEQIDIYKYLNLYHGIDPWEAIIMNIDRACHINRAHPETAPLAVYPIWKYGDSMTALEDMVAHPWGESMRGHTTLPKNLQPVKGQQHRIILCNLPYQRQTSGKSFLVLLSMIQEEFPDVIFHISGLYSFKTMFGMNFKAVDVEPRTSAQKGRINLPVGSTVYYESSFAYPEWVTLLGMRPVDMRIPRNRCLYNMRSAIWAAQHFKETVKFETRDKSKATDPDSLTTVLPSSHSVMSRRIPVSSGDKFLCNTCTLQTACKYFREGAVCIVPGSEPVELAKFFHSRDSDTIIDGLGTLLATQTHRLEKALATEEAENELLPEVTKIINTLFDRGRKLALLVNPSLAGGPKFQMHFGDTNNTQINAGTPQALMAAIVDEFAKRGIPRDHVTPEMVMKVFTEPEELRTKAIETAVAERIA